MTVARPRFLCPVLVGRERELAEASAPIEWTRAGQSSAVLIIGEAGIGKSRLVAEVRVRAEQAGLPSLLGRCFPEDRAYPLAPIFDMVRAARLSRDEDALGPLLAMDPAAAEPDPRPFDDPASRQEKRQLFRALETVVDRLAERAGSTSGAGPLLLVIEDLPGVTTPRSSGSSTCFG